MKKVAIIGNMGVIEKPASDGQTIKTRIVSKELINQLGASNVVTYNTYGGIINLFKAPFICLLALINASNVLIFPAQRGVRVYVPILAFLSFFFKNKRLHYSIIGGWLPHFLQNKKLLSLSLNSFSGIYAETNTMKVALQRHGLKNVFVVPNCKHLNIVSKDELNFKNNEPYKLCTFSRVNKNKGIEDAINVIQSINKKYNRIVYTLDIYGRIDSDQINWFNLLQSSFPKFVNYKGCIEFDKSTDVLKGYFALLFPTRYFTEGIPGTIIDAYAAGIPVISAKWQSFSDIIDNHVTGYGYDFNNIRALEQMLIDIAENPEMIHKLKENCIEKVYEYMPHKAVKIIVDNFID